VHSRGEVDEGGSDDIIHPFKHFLIERDGNVNFGNKLSDGTRLPCASKSCFSLTFIHCKKQFAH
jgi:hypothetical protein